MYHAKAQQATVAFQSGRHREAASNYLEAFKVSPGPNAENRWHIFHGYTSILREEYFLASQGDFDALEKIFKDKKELRLYRSEAAFTIGLLRYLQRDREEAAEWYRDAMRAAEKVPEKQTRKKTMATLTTPDGNRITGVGLKKVGELIDEICKQAADNLAALERGNLNRNTTPDTVRSDGTPMPQTTTRRTKIEIGPRTHTFTKEVADRLLSVGGEECDACKKTRHQLDQKHFDACSRCKRAYYCSKECQTAQWRAGHKHHCRKPGEFKAGDYVRPAGIVSRPEINGQLVQVIGSDPNTDGRWEVTIPGGEQSISLAGAKLEHLRPQK